MSNTQEKRVAHFELRSQPRKNRYNNRIQLNSVMERSSRPADIEKEQKLDRELLRELAKALEFLQNLED